MQRVPHLVAPLLLAGACIPPRPAAAGAPVAEAAAALFRAVVPAAERRDTALGASVATICVSVGPDSARADPGAALLARLRSLDARAVAGSGCGPLMADASGDARPQAWLWLGPVEAGDAGTAAASASWVRGPLWGYGYRCQLLWRDGRWTVSSCAIAWMA